MKKIPLNKLTIYNFHGKQSDKIWASVHQLEDDFLALANEYLDLVEGGSHYEKAYEILQRYDIVDEEGFRK